MLCRVEGTGEYSEAIILIKPQGEDKYIVIGKIYKTKNLNWTVNKDRSPTPSISLSLSKSWVVCAKELYAAFQVEAV